MREKHQNGMATAAEEKELNSCSNRQTCKNGTVQNDCDIPLKLRANPFHVCIICGAFELERKFACSFRLRTLPSLLA